MEAYPQHCKHQFIAHILHALHLTMDRFMYNLVHYSPYEMILYLWITKLYKKQTPTDQAIQLIYKARNVFLLRGLGVGGQGFGVRSSKLVL